MPPSLRLHVLPLSLLLLLLVSVRSISSASTASPTLTTADVAATSTDDAASWTTTSYFPTQFASAGAHGGNSQGRVFPSTALYPQPVAHTASLPKCAYLFTPQFTIYPYFINHRLVRLLVLHFAFPLQPKCYITRSDLESKLNQTEEIIGNIMFVCPEPGVDIVFQESEMVNGHSSLNASEERQHLNNWQFPKNTYKNYISYFSVMGCRVNIKAASIVAEMTDLRVLTMIGNRALDFEELQDEPASCLALKNVVTLCIINDLTLHNSMHHLVKCQGLLDNLAELIIYNTSLTAFPEALLKVTPSLQSIDIQNCSLTEPVDFVPAQGLLELPRNLSRTFEKLLGYDFDGSINLQTNIFRKVLLLTGNSIRNLTHYQFQGELQGISLERNGLEFITGGTFHNVTNLQYLTLAFNRLKSLPEDLFSHTPQLHRIDLQENRLEYLHENTFKNLIWLNRLDLKHNHIVMIQDGLFLSLERLTDLQLQYNRITHVSDNAFSKRSVKLNTVSLQHNPLKTFPSTMMQLKDLQLINLDFTDIEVLSLNDMCQNSDLAVYTNDVISTGAANFGSLGRGPETRVSLKNSQLQTMVLDSESNRTRLWFQVFIKTYMVSIEGSRLMCDCRILNLTHQLQQWEESGYLSQHEASLSSWTCTWPEELVGINVARLRDEDTYCPLLAAGSGNTSCPEVCKCYVRTGTGGIIVDCRQRGLTSMPSQVPANTRELWLQNNTIRTVDNVPYLQDLHTLDLSSNRVRKMPFDLVHKATALRVLHLRDNLLSGLDDNFRHLQGLEEASLAGNPFRCDCHTLWMKNWLLLHQGTVKDWSDIKCSTDGEEGRVLTAVPDDIFTCYSSASLGQLALPIASPLAFAFAILVLCVVAFLQRRRLKVWLYIHTGLHPFDRDPPHHRAAYDVSVCCDVMARDWVLQRVVKPLEEDREYKVFFYSRDAFVGFSTSENVAYCVRHSRRLVLVLDRTCWQQSDLLVTVTRQAVQKCRQDMVHFLTLLLHQVSSNDIHHKSIQHYIKRGRYIHTNDRHFFKKLLYEMPHLKTARNNAARDCEEQNRRRDRIVQNQNHHGGLGQRNMEGQEIVELNHIEVIANHQAVPDGIPVQNGHIAQPRGMNGIIPANTATDSVIIQQQLENRAGGSEEVQPGPGPASLHQPSDASLANGGIICQKKYEHAVVDRNGVSAAAKPTLQWQRSLSFAVPKERQSVFVWYADNDLPFTLRNIVEPVERQGHQCVLQDRDFRVGAPIQENIINAAEGCSRSIFVLSDQTADNEWFTFAFVVTFDHHLQSRDRHRILLVAREEVDVKLFVEEVQQAMKTSEVLVERDPWFGQKLRMFIDFPGAELA